MGEKYLVIRRDNIGDLVCTTPLLTLIAQTEPEIQLDVLVNSYNAAVVHNHPGIHQVYVYSKAKHRSVGTSLLAIYWHRVKLIWRLRREKYDVVFLAQRLCSTRLLRLASWLAPRKIIYFAEDKIHTKHKVSLSLKDYVGQPEAVVMAAMLSPLHNNAPTEIPACFVLPDSQAQQSALRRLKQQSWYRADYLTLAIHISARKSSQCWSVLAFSDLIRTLAEQYQVQFLVFWSPGDASNPLHPGDDNKAQALMKQVEGLPVLACPTYELTQLIAGLSVCDQVICSDGGAMHIAAGLGKPIVCLFGKSDAAVWHPWGVPYKLLQPQSLHVKDITVKEVAKAFMQLQEALGGSGAKRAS